ncbi:MAG: type II toxin-antitoxin system RelE/ParE family toxin [Ignavibacteria bacterium]
MYKILFTDRSKKDLKSLDISIQTRIVNKLKEYSSDPIHFSRKLQNSSIGTYRFRIGDYRISFDIAKDEVVI